MIALADALHRGRPGRHRPHRRAVVRHPARRPRRVPLLPARPRNGGESAAAIDDELDEYLHLYTLNRGILITPFHNMALMCPATTAADVDRHSEVFESALAELFARA